MRRKLCYTCRETKLLDQFNRNRAKKDGYSSICRACSNARSKRYYHDNTGKHKKVVLARKQRVTATNRALVLEYLLSNSCRSCGESDPVVLEFDHLRDKDKSVKTMVFEGLSEARIKKEIGKCQVLCANCHRRKTAKEQNWFKLDILGV